ncbi:hypothetical protein AMTR_s00050p00143540 [Amborella trichopoda]|uniref:Uncharacterized protein n=1 Tax=Amborella trichopoda TaxID=13333 RepID=W1PXY1_AMBTC|nr:hypothetical protein AMTR_s00050p00143540 [Amborella trichopoda]
MPIDASEFELVVEPSLRCKSAKLARPSIVPELVTSAPSLTTLEAQGDAVSAFNLVTIPSDQKATPDPGVASLVQEAAPMTVEPMRELTLIPSSPRRASLDLPSCPGENDRSQLAKASEDTSGATKEGPIAVQGEDLRVDEASRHYEVAASNGVGDEGPGTARGVELAFSEELNAAAPYDMAGGVGDKGSRTSQGEEPSVNEMPEHPEAIVPD